MAAVRVDPPAPDGGLAEDSDAAAQASAVAAALEREVFQAIPPPLPADDSAVAEEDAELLVHPGSQQMPEVSGEVAMEVEVPLVTKGVSVRLAQQAAQHPEAAAAGVRTKPDLVAEQLDESERLLPASQLEEQSVVRPMRAVAAMATPALKMEASERVQQAPTLAQELLAL